METTIFIGAIIAGVTQWIKLVTPPQVSGHWIIPIAAGVGLVVALLDTQLGLPNITIAAGILTGLGAAGVVATAQNIGGSTPSS